MSNLTIANLLDAITDTNGQVLRNEYMNNTRRFSNLESKMEELGKDNDDLKRANNDLMKANNDLMKANDDVMKANDDLKRANVEIKQQLDVLSSEVTNIKMALHSLGGAIVKCSCLRQMVPEMSLLRCPFCNDTATVEFSDSIPTVTMG